jgi:hypothetical protein
LSALLGILRDAWRKLYRARPSLSGLEFELVEMNAGEGLVSLPDGRVVEGTAVRSERTFASEVWPLNAHYCDVHGPHIQALNSNLGRCPPDVRREFIVGDSSLWLPEWVQRLPGRRAFEWARPGLVVADPPGETLFAPLIEAFGNPANRRVTGFIDVLIYFQAGMNKRTLNAFPGSGRLPLDDALSQIPKKWLIREPEGANQFTFLLGTGMGQPFDWKRRGYHLLASPEGRAIQEWLIRTVAQRNGSRAGGG